MNNKKLIELEKNEYYNRKNQQLYHRAYTQ